MKKIILVGILISISSAIAADGFCISDFCVFPKATLYSQIVKNYGGSQKAEHLCFDVRDQSLYLTVRRDDHHNPKKVEKVSISTEKPCKSPISPIKPFARLTTSNGLTLGDSVEKVVSLYGKPTWIRVKDQTMAERMKSSGHVAVIEKKHQKDEIPFGELMFGYVPDPNDLQATFVSLNRDKVVAIEISYSE